MGPKEEEKQSGCLGLLATTTTSSKLLFYGVSEERKEENEEEGMKSWWGNEDRGGEKLLERPKEKGHLRKEALVLAKKFLKLARI